MGFNSAFKELSEVTSSFSRPQPHCVAGIDRSLNFKGKSFIHTSVGREVCSYFWRPEQLQSVLHRDMFRANSFQKYDSRPRGHLSLALWGNPQSNRYDRFNATIVMSLRIRSYTMSVLFRLGTRHSFQPPPPTPHAHNPFY